MDKGKKTNGTQELWQGKSVLIVDDSPQVQSSLRKIYESFGFTVVGTASDGNEALHKYAELKPDLVSLDIIMPNMHGIECYRLLLAQNPSAKVIFVSRLAKDKQVSSSYEKEIPEHLFIAKPVDPAHLQECLSKVFA
jgi:two-component system chemotaxis response regulator CheY